MLLPYDDTANQDSSWRTWYVSFLFHYDRQLRAEVLDRDGREAAVKVETKDWCGIGCGTASAMTSKTEGNSEFGTASSPFWR